MKTKVNEISLVGPKGRSELIKKINELEAQVAQQDYLVVEVSSVEADTIIADENACRQLFKYKKAGVLFNVILQDKTMMRSRILADTRVRNNIMSIVFYDFGEGALTMAEITDPDAE